MNPSLNTWTIIFLIAAVQGVFLTLMIALRKNGPAYLLSALMLSFSICLLYYVAYWTRYLIFIPREMAVVQGLTYLFGPLLYFYIRSDRKHTYFSLLHFLPFSAYLIYFVFLPGIDPSIRIIQTAIQVAHLVGYGVTAIFWTLGSRREANLYGWRLKVSLAFEGYAFSFLLYYILVWTSVIRIEYDYMISFASAFFIYFIGYHGYQHPEIFKKYEGTKYDKSGLSHSAARAVLHELKRYMVTARPYLNSELKMEDLARALSLSSHHISQVVNELEGLNFSDFVNNYRIDDAKRMIITDHQNKKLLHIAYDAGFNNKTSFNSAFKKFTGTSPSAFRKEHALPADQHHYPS